MEDFSLSLLTLSLIENFLLSFLIFSLLSLKIKFKFIFFFTSITIIILTVRSLPVNSVVLIFAGIFIYLIYLRVFYDVLFIPGFVASGLSILIYMLLENTLVPLFINLLAIDIKLIITNPFYRFLLFLPQASIMFILSILCRINRKINLREWLKGVSKEDIEFLADEEFNILKEKRICSIMDLVTVFLIIQGIFILAYNTAVNMKENQLFSSNSFITTSYFTNIIILFFTLLMIWLLKHLLDVIRMQKNEILVKIEEKSLKRMNWELEMQRHDYNHHLGMLNMLIRMNHCDEARIYLKGVVDELEKINEVINSGNKSLDALFYSKIARGRKEGIELKVDVRYPIENLRINNWDLIRIVGNLLDNAIEASQALSAKGEVCVKIEGKGEGARIRVKTKGIMIAEEIKNHIFERGYSSKKELGHGMGLAICKDLVDKYHGDIYVKRDEINNDTIFTVKLPSELFKKMSG